MANTLLTPSVIAKEALMQLENNLVLGNLVFRQYENAYVKIGDTLTVRKPVRFTVTDGATLTQQDITESSVSVVVNKRKHVGFGLSAQELTLNIEEFSERYVQPAMIKLANQVDADLAALYIDVPAAVGVPGVPPSSLNHLLSVRKMMNDLASPMNGRNLVVDPSGEANLISGFSGIFQETIVKEIVQQAKIGRKSDFDILMDQNVKQHTAGTRSGTPLVNGATQSGASLITDGWTASSAVLKKGDIFTIAGVNRVNPVSYNDTGSLQQFVVTADGTADGSGNLTIAISPAITLTGASQNVTALPADNAAITVIGNHTANLAFVAQAFALVTVPIEIPASVVWGKNESYNGVSIRLVRSYDVTNDKEIYRFDIMYGVKTIYPELAVRVLG